MHSILSFSIINYLHWARQANMPLKSQNLSDRHLRNQSFVIPNFKPVLNQASHDIILGEGQAGHCFVPHFVVGQLQHTERYQVVPCFDTSANFADHQGILLDGICHCLQAQGRDLGGTIQKIQWNQEKWAICMGYFQCPLARLWYWATQAWGSKTRESRECIESIIGFE